MNITSNFAVLDVKRDRTILRQKLESGKAIQVTIVGIIDSEHSKDDGTSQEFSVNVTSLQFKEVRAKP